MKILLIDPSGKVPLYDQALCNALIYEADIEFASPYNKDNEFCNNSKFVCLFQIPIKWKNTALIRLKPVVGLINYIYISFLLLFKHYDVVHFQWLPFLEYIGIEKYFLKLFHLISPKTKFILTQHNLYPHNSSELKKKKYHERMQNVKAYFSHFIVHTKSSKYEFCEEYDIGYEKVSVVYHGIFEPKNLPDRKSPLSPVRFLIFGVQSKYKGTDIVVDAIDLLPNMIRKEIHVTIAGKTDGYLFNEKKDVAKQLGIEWINRFISDEELNQLIIDSDVIMLPYRSISQSGVLLLSLSFKKHIIASDLQSFRETLEGYPEECFVNVGSANSLAEAIVKFVEGRVDVDKELVANRILIDKYSWKSSAKKTNEVYCSLF